ncbi:MAG: ribosomal protein [Eubacterium sp.]|nr:ribosomal protein [Eubacterium sp.]
MPNIKSAIKRVKVTETKTLKNTIRKSALKTTVKKCKEAIAKGEGAAEAYKSTTKALDKAAAKNLLHKNTAARRKSRLAKALNAAK